MAAGDHNHDTDYVAKTAAANIPDPTGGETADAEARTAIVAILNILEAPGFQGPPNEPAGPENRGLAPAG